MNLTATIKFKDHVASVLLPENSWNVYLQIKIPNTGLIAHF